MQERDIDFSRSETRYFIPNLHQFKLLEGLSKFLKLELQGKPPKETTILQTFYFGQNRYLPREVLLRLRRYNFAIENDAIRLSPNDECVLEIKSSPDGSVDQWKERETISAHCVLDNLDKPAHILNAIQLARFRETMVFITKEKFDLFLRGIDPERRLELLLATEAVRRHFTPSKSVGLRVTVDSDQRYFGFDQNNTGVVIGAEDHLKVEVKFTSSTLSVEIEEITSLLQACCAFIIDSRKSHIQNLYTIFRTKNLS